MHTTPMDRMVSTRPRRSTTIGSSTSCGGTSSASCSLSTRRSGRPRGRTALGRCCCGAARWGAGGAPSSCRTRRRRTSGCSARPTSPPSRRDGAGGEAARMARRKKKRTLRPRLPARIRKKRKGATKSGQQHHELTGLGLLGLGLFLATILYLGWNGGTVGGGIADGFRTVIGAAAYAAPIACLVVGALMVARSELVDVRPFRTGILVTSFGLLTTLGRAHGGAIGSGFERLFGTLLGTTGTTILGVLALVIGMLLLTGASAGALVRRSGHAVKRAHKRARGARRYEPAPAEPPAPV